MKNNSLTIQTLNATLRCVFFSLTFMVITSSTQAEDTSLQQLAQDYFSAWTQTQRPDATLKDIHHYLSLLTDDVGHQHLPYDTDDSREKSNKLRMFKGMEFYLGSHSKYQAQLINLLTGHEVIVLQYETTSEGVHPQTKEKIVDQYLTTEILEVEKNKVSMIRKYSK